MGMFDSLVVVCPQCNFLVEFQSKAGDCVLANYTISDVPSEIAMDIRNDSESCENCGHEVKLIVDIKTVIKTEITVI